MIKSLSIAALLLIVAAPAVAEDCPSIRAAADRHANALKLAKCLGDRDPKIRDTLAFGDLQSVMREGGLETPTLRALKAVLLDQLRQTGASTLLQSFSALTLSEVTRTDRIKPWMRDDERQELVEAAAIFLTGITDYRAFTDKEGYIHAVAHGADFAMQLALNPAITKAQIDRLLAAIATQISPRTEVAYWAGEPDRLARAVVVIAQRKLLSDGEWEAWFAGVMDPKPLASWSEAFEYQTGIRKHHNVRAFLLSVFASAITSDDGGIKQLVGPTRDSLKYVP